MVRLPARTFVFCIVVCPLGLAFLVSVTEAEVGETGHFIGQPMSLGDRADESGLAEPGRGWR
jgi:hypothetical protein